MTISLRETKDQLDAHGHTAGQITGLPTSLPANGGNAATVSGFTVAKNIPVGALFTDTITTVNGKT